LREGIALPGAGGEGWPHGGGGESMADDAQGSAGAYQMVAELGEACPAAVKGGRPHSGMEWAAPQSGMGIRLISQRVGAG